MSGKPTFGTLFSGGGIADIGFVAAGMEPRWAVECDSAIAGVYRENFPGHPCYTSTVEDIDWSRMEPVDHGHASPSCKMASRANQNGGECEGDLSAARAVCAFIDVIRPRTFSLENVWAYRNFRSFKMVLECLEDRGYFVHYEHLNSADFGVPQTRERLILRACREAMVPILPGPTRWVGWYEAIEDLIPTLPESQFAAWQLARLPDCFGDLLVSNSKTEYGDGARISGAPVFTVTTQSNGRTRAFVMSGTNGMIRDGGDPYVTVTAAQGKDAITSRAFLFGDQTSTDGRDVSAREDVEPSQTVTTKHCGRLRALIVHAQDQRTMPVLGGLDPMFTILAGSGRSLNMPRAFIADGQPNGNSETLTVRDGEDRVFTIQSSAVKKPARAWLEHGRVVKMTPRALARFQSIPDSYQLPDRASLACTIIGNGWPSLMAQRVGECFLGEVL